MSANEFVFQYFYLTFFSNQNNFRENFKNISLKPFKSPCFNSTVIIGPNITVVRAMIKAKGRRLNP
jgi:hypothetical protein